MTLTYCCTAIRLCEENIAEIDETLEALKYHGPTHKHLSTTKDTYYRHLNNLTQMRDRLLNGIFLEALTT